MGRSELDSTIATCRTVLARRPSGLFADIDGTLSPIAPTPEGAIVPDRIRAALATLAGRVDLLVAITGRGVDDARRLVGLDQIGYVGNHGLERWHEGRVVVHRRAEPYVPLVAGALRDLARAVPLAGLIFEDKGATASIHYRLAPDPAAARAALLRAIERSPSASGLRAVDGRLVLNLLPPLRLDKGYAVEELVREHDLRGVLFLGDDVTDLDAFRALRRLRAGQDIETLGVGVFSPEGPPELAELADVSVDGVDAVAALLEALAAAPSDRSGP
jgi:trehalose 6-phosphate phosphatase